MHIIGTNSRKQETEQMSFQLTLKCEEKIQR
jgi:hypothetical protein